MLSTASSASEQGYPWAEHADYVDQRAALLTQKMLELSALQPGERVLELACGPGSDASTKPG